MVVVINIIKTKERKKEEALVFGWLNGWRWSVDGIKSTTSLRAKKFVFFFSLSLFRLLNEHERVTITRIKKESKITKFIELNLHEK
jgi:hypothetical protein